MEMESAVGVGTSFRFQIHDIKDVIDAEGSDEADSPDVAA
jgi:hypothetical protein